RALRRARGDAAGADPGDGWLRGEITGEDAVRRKVAVVVAVVVKPAAGVAVAYGAISAVSNIAGVSRCGDAREGRRADDHRHPAHLLSLGTDGAPIAFPAG